MTTKKLQNIVGVLKDWLVSIYLYHKGKDTLPVFIIKDVDFVFLNSLRSFFVREQFIMLTEDDIREGSDVFCLKLLHIKIIHEASQKEISKISNRELWLIGIALYWAEGSKSKTYSPSIGVVFTNSDYEMVQIFIRWLKYCCRVGLEQLSYLI